MSTSTALRPAVRAAFTALIDYAGLFPPAQLPMRQAAAEYRRERAGPFAWMLGRFIVPARALQTLPPELDGSFSVTVQDLQTLPLVAEHRRAGVRVEALEIAPLPSDEPFRNRFAYAGLSEAIALTLGETDGVLKNLPAYFEIREPGSWDELLAPAMSALHDNGFGAKIRCGGVTADAFPSVEGVAAFIGAARSQNVPFKATAGLHHPIRHVDLATGFHMHGFLNILAAAAFAPRVDRATLASIVAEEDPDAFDFDDESFAWRDQRVTTSELERTRREGFVAYGSCSFDEPVDDLIGLGILPAR